MVAKDQQDCEFITVPAGAEIEVDGEIVTTPATVSLSTKRNHVVKWPDGTTSEVVRTIHGAYIGNAVWLLAAPIGFIVDMTTGAAERNLTPRRIEWHEGKGVVFPVPHDAADDSATRWE